MIFVSNEETFLLQLQQEIYWLLLFIPKAVASMEVDIDFRASVLVRQSSSSKRTTSTITQPVFALLR